MGPALDPKYSAICGYTEFDLDSVFAAELDGLNRDEIREWYNGYNWLGEEKVYNPYDILHLFKNREFKHWWCNAGASRLRTSVLKGGSALSIELDRIRSRGCRIESFNVELMDPEALLFQTGYLTIAEKVDGGGWTRYRLDYPNREVREGLNQLMLEFSSPESRRDS